VACDNYLRREPCGCDSLSSVGPFVKSHVRSHPAHPLRQ
jgi:hypothetical protein